MKTAPLIIVLVALCGCGEKKKPVGSGDGVRIAPKSAPGVPETGEEKSSLAEFIRNKRVFVLMEKEGSDEEVLLNSMGMVVIKPDPCWMAWLFLRTSQIKVESMR